MTTNQTIDGVPRKLVRENIAYLRGMGGTYDQRSALAAKFELLLLDPAPPKELREQYEAWADANGYDITRNEHGDYAGIVEDSMWTGWQARGELRALLDKTEADIPASVPQGEPVALKEAYEEGFSDGSRAGDDQYNWEGFRDELAKAWPVCVQALRRAARAGSGFQAWNSSRSWRNSQCRWVSRCYRIPDKSAYGFAQFSAC